MENKFISGAFVSRKDTAPEFVITDISFNEKFIEYYNEHKNEKGYLNTQLKRSGSTGKLYLDLNDWKPQEHFVKNQDGTIGVEEVEDKVIEAEDEIKVENIPFNQDLSKS